MKSDLYAMTLSGIFAALCYVTMLPLVGFYNVFLTLFICFTAGVLLGVGWGIWTGMVGMFLCSYFNPLGAALPPIMIAQMTGAAFAGFVGGIFGRRLPVERYSLLHIALMGAFGLLTALVYHVLVDLVDAWLWGPFWVRLKIGLASSLVTIASNIVIFVTLYPILRVLRGVVQYRS